MGKGDSHEYLDLHCFQSPKMKTHSGHFVSHFLILLISFSLPFLISVVIS